MTSTYWHCLIPFFFCHLPISISSQLRHNACGARHLKQHPYASAPCPCQSHLYIACPSYTARSNSRPLSNAVLHLSVICSFPLSLLPARQTRHPSASVSLRITLSLYTSLAPSISLRCALSCNVATCLSCSSTLT
ncbi:hypothetical protein LZ30DRAFT_255918 [Colletotrichum cereale]|nr:hypothetical protein LZ30DRAFT_255918 [Colletotrichum cereale]